MRWLAWMRRPWLHFIVLGLVLFNLQLWLFPEPRPVVGPLNEARIEALEQQWFTSTGRPPSTQQLERIVAAELDRDMLFLKALELEVHLYDNVVYQRLLRNMNFLQLAEGKTDEALYREALEMRLHLGDEVVKRRLIQIMEQLLLSRNPPASPSETELAAEFSRRKTELREPVRYSIEHLYFTREREAEIDSVAATIAQEKLSAAAARKMSSPFLPGYVFSRQTPDQLARHFGAAFVMNLEAAVPQAGQWVGPVRSTYGQHYVFVSALEPERDTTLEEVRAQLQRDLESQAHSAALQAAITELRNDYEVRI
ncbi:MAG: peptidyl-prolyl cis-trans isomerase [Halieaceae bacterium]|jgi:parvulin-like peptidyl-prolyl isomerase|nr:peptidyl-prolyl cis-trans isomerase [Halieaceae bacterium]